MSLADMAEDSLPSPSSSSSRVSLTVPTSLLILPSTAALIGLSIGIVRGGNRARLRFLAENAHRQPKTIQGWYFYTKTRNYRVFFSAAKTGSRYALALGGVTALYVILDESTGWIRESFFGPSGDLDAGKIIPRSKLGSTSTSSLTGNEEEEAPFKRVGWRRGQVKWEDGAVAGSLLGAGVGIAYRLPRPLFVRSLLMGGILGGTTSALQIAQAHVGRLREEQERAAAITKVSGLATSPTSEINESGASVALTTEESAPVLVSGPRQTDEAIARGVAADPTALSGLSGDVERDADQKSWSTKLKGLFGL